MAAALSSQMPGQIVGWPAAMRVMSRKPPAASCSRAPCSSPRSAASAIRVAAVRWGTWETTATSESCSAGVQGDHVGPELGQDGVDPGIGAGVGGRGRGEHPGCPDEELARGALDADLLAAGHGVAADEPGPVDGGHQGALDAADVGHHGIGVPPVVVQDVGDDRRGHVHRRGHHHQLGRAVLPLGVERPQLHGPGGRARGGVGSGHVPAPGAQGHAHRPADEAGADDHGPPGGTVGRDGSVSREGRHGVPGRPRGTRGRSRPSGGRW